MKLLDIIKSLFAKETKENTKTQEVSDVYETTKKSKFGISENDYKNAAESLQCDVAAIKAFAKVESRGSGFLSDSNPVILFERHIFYRLLKEKGISCNDTSICSTRTGGYLGGTGEHDRLKRAVDVDRDSALQSASWGMFQCMGFNWKVCGYKSLQEFINAAYRSEKDHLDMFVGFIKSNNKLLTAVRNKDWPTAARIYNGPAYKKNNYDVKLAQAYSEELEKRNTV